MTQPTKPLNRLGELNPMPERVLNQPVKGPKSTHGRDTPHHSDHSRTRSEHYHAAILGGRESAARVTDQLNPDRTISQARTQGRRFPGLAN